MSFNSMHDLVNSIVRPTASRPILGSNRVISSTKWPSSWSSNSDADDMTPILTPELVGSPLKSCSPRVWSQYVNPFDVIQNQTISLSAKQLKSFDGTFKADFQNNGKDVPIDSNEIKGLPYKPIVSPTTSVAPYQLFGTNGFSYAKFSSGPVGDKIGSNNRLKNKRRIKTQTFCSFCKNNNETPEVYNSHVVKDPYGRTTCPVLREYDCPKCRSGGGDNGHTIRYCPLNRPGFEDYIPSVIKQLKNSRSADGKKKTTF